ncbi:MAG: type II secretion system F family protein [Chloroflexi bacterium]|nr:type II secretion system F family protein [Chloroflexota bacterium]
MGNIILIGILAVVLLTAVGLIAVSIARNNETDPLESRLADYASEQTPSANLEDIEMSVPFSERVLIPIFKAIANFTQSLTPEEALQNTEKQLVLAGNPGNLTPQVVWGMRFVAGGALLFVMLFVMVVAGWFQSRAAVAVLIVLGSAVFGFFMPILWIKSKIDRRQQEIIKSLPDALDLMSICVEAGLGFDQAMQRVYDKWDNELGLAFGRVVREIQFGRTRREAMRNLAESVDVPDMTTFAGAIIQADQLGVSISKVLKIQSDQMRVKRRQRAQEKAQQAPVKMMIPMVLFIFPSIYIVLLGPAGVQLAKQFLGW